MFGDWRTNLFFFRSETPHFDCVWSRTFCTLLPVVFISSVRKVIKIYQCRNEIFLSARSRSSVISSIIRVTNCGYLSRRMPSRDDPLLQGVRSFFWRHFHNGWMMDGQLLIWSELPETNYASRAGKTAQSYYITVGFSHIEFQIVSSDSYYPRGLKCKGSKTQRKKETKKERKKERKKE